MSAWEASLGGKICSLSCVLKLCFGNDTRYMATHFHAMEVVRIISIFVWQMFTTMNVVGEQACV